VEQYKAIGKVNKPKALKSYQQYYKTDYRRKNFQDPGKIIVRIDC
jgi:hypothetical protein